MKSAVSKPLNIDELFLKSDFQDYESPCMTLPFKRSRDQLEQDGSYPYDQNQDQNQNKKSFEFEKQENEMNT